jgi:hypothetical protein
MMDIEETPATLANMPMQSGLSHIVEDVFLRYDLQLS